MRRLPVFLCVALISLSALQGCATLRSLRALSAVDFDLDRVGALHLAGVDLLRVRGFDDLSTGDAVRVLAALAGRELPLEIVLDVSAANPEGNPDARLLELDWTLFLRDRETVSGALDGAVALPAGETTRFPVRARLDLLEFFDGSARDLVDLAASLAGVGGEPVSVRLEAIPGIDTPLGPIRYPRPITIGTGS